jgi:peptidoglycan/xylan/chitin deacetylase (PgdA/CDA1 family)
MGRERSNLLRVLTYHRVDEPNARPTLCPSLISATPKDFDSQMAYLAAEYRVVSMNEVLRFYRYGIALPPRCVLVTFDDAYCDFAEHAWPIMKRYGLPATLFVPTAYPDQPQKAFWWDRLYHAVAAAPNGSEVSDRAGALTIETYEDRAIAFVRLRDHVKALRHAEAMQFVDYVCGELKAPPVEHSVLGWDELRALAREGVTLGAHTRTHPLLNRVTPDEARAEAAGSVLDLEREVGSIPPVFAYPSGGCDDEVVRVLNEEGFVLAFATRRGINDVQRANRLMLRRVNVGRRTPQPLLRAQLLPWSRYLSWS